MKGSLLDFILFNFNNDFIVLLRHFCTKCAVCKKPITALKGETKIKKLRAMGKEYHLHCFKCEVSKISFFVMYIRMQKFFLCLSLLLCSYPRISNIFFHRIVLLF